MEKQKMSIEKKTKLIYSGELLLFAIVFAVIATLEIIGVIGKREVMMIIFNWVTIFGGTWLIADFIWVLCSKKRKARNSILDKALVVPLGIYLITFDIMCFCKLPFITMEFRRLMMAIAFYYVSAIYLFQGIYHYYFPIPSIREAIIEEEAAALEKEKASNEASETENKEQSEEK